MFTLWNKFPQIYKQINRVEKLIDDRLHTNNPNVEELLRALADDQGKQLRPGLFLLFSQLGDQKLHTDEELIKIAASVEILHKATLIHDDIIDDSPLRRGKITIQSKYGKDVAVYAGDLLFTVFFSLLTEAMNGSKYMSYNSQAMYNLLVGELSQMHLRYSQTQTIDDYLKNIQGKTAALFKLACMEGIHFSEPNEKRERLAGDIGLNIGIAFQIYDDILDYTSTTKDLKKPVLEDVAEGVYSSPLLFAFAKAPAEFKPLLDKKQDIKPAEIKEVARLVKKYNGVKDAQELAQHYTDLALEEIDLLGDRRVAHQIKTVAIRLLNRAS
ncbi:polyprenyl synthetase family protein [Ligilactobacillus pobuzihii]|uniref:Polyprenyl diphosphate synthase n=1 Tax=Ligilactobacillus pobuzihii TaxID=449659 RepID=A0A0R2L1P1_9LACO|nr:polyprenyl synthetase family protein [Ligilactobacillus pobuzihii]KRK09944.1 polyprenyl diphosphate synthase [Ligilactobacillus pobuzihii E100301 = KCTC 13174]KRN95635.1 polyprenyl diphosphate synthase [Ligilactobacillus pobuzihii]GEN47947.1 geranylgeranyl pyrophosphate synthase [Ligilactobacillus pobuzihii]